jgi:hypothetical protein
MLVFFTTPARRQAVEHSCSEDFIIDLFYRVDCVMADVPKRSDALLWPGEIVTLAILFVLKGRSERAFDRWARRDLRPLFPATPERTRLFRLFVAHRDWAERFLADPTLFGIADSFGIELISTRRLGRSPRQIAKKGKCAGKWIAGAKLGMVINCDGQFCAWDVTTANVYDANAFSPLIANYADTMIVLADCNFHKSPHHRGPDDQDPPNVKICPRHQWSQRRLIETVLSMLDRVCRLKHLTERTWPMLRAHLGFVAAAFNLLTRGDDGKVKLTIAPFAL